MSNAAVSRGDLDEMEYKYQGSNAGLKPYRLPQLLPAGRTQNSARLGSAPAGSLMQASEDGDEPSGTKTVVWYEDSGNEILFQCVHDGWTGRIRDLKDCTLCSAFHGDGSFGVGSGRPLVSRAEVWPHVGPRHGKP